MPHDAIREQLGTCEQEPAGGPPDGPVESGEWGMVVVKHGPHKDRIGYYDDEGYRDDYGIVYFGVPLIERFYGIKLTRLRPATVDEIQKWAIEVDNDINCRRALAARRNK
jgi:hypothetical protein